MPYKRILFIGLGGAGQRHLRLFKENATEETEFIAYRSKAKTPVLNPDFTVNKNATLEELYGVKIFDQLNEAIDANPDLVVISTPSSMHMEYAQLCAERGINIFVEKPLSNSHQGFKKLHETVLENEISIQVGFQRRYHPHLENINKLIKSGEIGDIINAIFTVASYVPFWHPYEDYRQLYACRNDLGGGVLLTEIHEFDLCIWYFGKPNSVTCVGGTYSNVGLDVEDTTHVTLDYLSFSVQINLTFWQKHAERSLLIAGEDGYLSWNQEDNTLKVDNYQKQNIRTISDSGVSNEIMFDLQVRDVLDGLTSERSSINLENSFISLSIVMAAKKSMDEKRSVKLEEIYSCVNSEEYK